MKTFRQIKAISAGLLLSCSVIPVVMAEDIEIYTQSGAQTSGAKPNLLFLIDGSIDMLATSDVTVGYDPATTYTGDCNNNYIYYTDDGSTPDCDGNGSNSPEFFNASALVCKDATTATEIVFDTDGITPISTIEVDSGLLTVGKYNDQIAHYRSESIKVKGNTSIVTSWGALDTSTSAEQAFSVECLADSGVHGLSD